MENKIVKINLTMIAICLTMALLIPETGIASWTSSYYETHDVSLEDIQASHGHPINIIKMDNGVEKMIFGPKFSEIGYLYFLIKDGKVIDRGVTDTKGKKAGRKTVVNKAPEAKGLMARYFQKNPMSVEELKAKWGEPVSNHNYEGGITKLTFGPKFSEVGYHYFLVNKEGMVIDQGCSDTK